MTDMLTREQIDFILEHMTGADVIEHIGDGRAGAKVAGAAFDAAAARLQMTNGTPAMELLRIQDFTYMAKRFGEVIDLDSPKSEQLEGSPDSVSTGE